MARKKNRDEFKVGVDSNTAPVKVEKEPSITEKTKWLKEEIEASLRQRCEALEIKGISDIEYAKASSIALATGGIDLPAGIAYLALKRRNDLISLGLDVAGDLASPAIKPIIKTIQEHKKSNIVTWIARRLIGHIKARKK